MWESSDFTVHGISIKLIFLWLVLNFPVTLSSYRSPVTAVLLSGSPVNVRGTLYNSRPVHSRVPTRRRYEDEEYYYYDDEPQFRDEDGISFEPADVIEKFSPVVRDKRMGFQPGLGRTDFNQKHTRKIDQPMSRSPSDTSVTYHSIATSRPVVHFSTEHDQNFDSSARYPVRNYSPDHVSSNHKFSSIGEAMVTSNYTVSDEIGKQNTSHEKTLFQTHFNRNNFTEINETQDIYPSETVLQYQPLPKTEYIPQNFSILNGTDAHIFEVPNISPSSSFDIAPSVLKSDIFLKDGPEVPVSTITYTPKFPDYTTPKNSVYYIENTTVSTLFPFDLVTNVSDIMSSISNTKTDKLSSAAVAGIVIFVLTFVTLCTSAVIYMLYRRYNDKCTSVVEGKFNSDNCGYLDDSLRSSIYLNNHVELPKENSEEMTSLDNDSFLNSLETMTIQNYWADNTKNTKV